MTLQAGLLKLIKEQLEWFYILKNMIGSSLHVKVVDNLGVTPFDATGCRERMWQLFGEGKTGIIYIMNVEMAG